MHLDRCGAGNEETGAIFGSVSAQLHKSGRSADFRVQDIWIASQAIKHGYRLLTRNQRDFQDIPGLDLIVLGGTRPE